MRARVLMVPCLALAALASGANGQWTATRYHPPGEALAGAGSQVVGYDAMEHAGLWNSPSSFVSLHPPGMELSFAAGTDGVRQFGSVVLPGGSTSRAAMWSGSAASFVDLTPAWSESASIIAASGGQQVGAVSPRIVDLNAAVWTATAASCVNLHPAGAEYSVATETDGASQVGWIWSPSAGGRMRASLWYGTATSMVDLHPSAVHSSRASGVFGGRQGGDVLFTGSEWWETHASIWTGSAESWVDLNPAGAVASGINAMDAGIEVGFAKFEGYSDSRAGVWYGSAESFEDLSVFLPGGSAAWSESRAYGVWVGGDTFYVYGSARRLEDGVTEAIVWSRPIPSPGVASMGIVAGTLLGRRRPAMSRPG
ncbi:MAG: hypothetical protein AMXMBFR58_29100 [Phycisphaerae bacterium]